uniref:Malonyl-CoA:ACP transacylase (MAT) domain-containing protein n=1 Tax=Brassica oleracea var. oleracea TaxID=109376 RepID=A0A0D3C309_BRAOL
MRSLLHQPAILRTALPVHSLNLRTMATASSLLFPSVSLNKLSSSRNASSLGFSVTRSRVSMSLSTESQTAINDSLFAHYKPSSAFLFPGQGAQAIGMGQEAQSVAAAADLYTKANHILGYDLLDICVNGPKEKLDSTVISQPAIYVTSLAAVELLRVREGGEQIINSVDVTCGLSLGEYTALAFAGAFSFEDGLKLVKLRGEAMQAAADAAKSAMVSIIGLDSEKVQQLCDAANQEVEEADKVQIANYLCPGNYAVSGGLKGIEAVEAKAKSFKARMTLRGRESSPRAAAVRLGSTWAWAWAWAWVLGLGLIWIFVPIFS